MFENRVRDYLDLHPSNGDFGVEIEMEVNRPIRHPFVEDVNKTGWDHDTDGSLRGNSCELVMNSPKSLNSVAKSVLGVQASLSKHNMIINPSIRAGVHIHMNMQKATIGQVYKFLMCYYPIETVLLRQCGFGRQGNLFCLGARDANWTIDKLDASIQSMDFYNLRCNSLRYSAMNFQSLFKYGSVELRALATTPDLNNIVPWCKVLHNVRSYAFSVENSWDNLVKISGNGPASYLQDVIGEEFMPMFEYKGMEKDIVNDMRNVQAVCHSLGEEGV